MVENHDETTKLFQFMLEFDNNDLPDGAWQAILEDAVRSFNKANKTYYDPFVTFLEYCVWSLEQLGLQLND